MTHFYLCCCCIMFTAVLQKVHGLALKSMFLVNNKWNTIPVKRNFTASNTSYWMVFSSLPPCSVFSVRAGVGLLSNYFSSLSVILIVLSLLTHSSSLHPPSPLVGAARARSEWLPNAVCLSDCMLHVTSCKIIETRIAPLFSFEFAIAPPLPN